MSKPHDEEYWEYEMGLEGEYEYPLPPGYESWAEWHYVNGDRMPDESDYYEENDVYKYEDINLGLNFDYIYDDKTNTYYFPKTGKRMTQKQLDAETDNETARINAIAARLEKQSRMYESLRKRQQQKQKNSRGTRMSKEERKRKAKELGVHPDMFSRNDANCWKCIRDFDTWFYKHPRIYTIFKYVAFIFILINFIFILIIFLAD